jgi:hypothetical protein
MPLVARWCWTWLAGPMIGDNCEVTAERYLDKEFAECIPKELAIWTKPANRVSRAAVAAKLREAAREDSSGFQEDIIALG